MKSIGGTRFREIDAIVADRDVDSEKGQPLTRTAHTQPILVTEQRAMSTAEKELPRIVHHIPIPPVQGHRKMTAFVDIREVALLRSQKDRLHILPLNLNFHEFGLASLQFLVICDQVTGIEGFIRFAHSISILSQNRNGDKDI